MFKVMYTFMYEWKNVICQNQTFKTKLGRVQASKGTVTHTH